LQVQTRKPGEGEEDGQIRIIDGAPGGSPSRGFHEAVGFDGGIGEIVHERRRITAETALRLARYFKTNAEFSLNLQNFYDLEVTRRSGKISEIERQVQPVGADVA